MIKTSFVACVLSTLCGVSLWAADFPVVNMTQVGQPLPGTSAEGGKILSNEPDGKASLALEFDLSSIKDDVIPLAVLKLNAVEKVDVKRPGQKSSAERAVMCVYTEQDGGERLHGSLPTKAGGRVSDYEIDVTTAINEALSHSDGKGKLLLKLRLDGKPTFFETYSMKDGSPVLAVFPKEGWTDDWQKRLEPLGTTPHIYQEAVFPVVEKRGGEVTLPLLYPAKRILGVSLPASGRIFEEGRDWQLREGKLVLPAGSRVPVLTRDEFETAEKKSPDGTTKVVKSKVRLEPGTWFHERQIAVDYEAESLDWKLPAPISSLKDLPRLKEKLEAGKPVSVLLFGDSISAGGDCSALHAVPPYQPNYGVLVARMLARRYGSDVTFINPSRAGATSAYGAIQAETQVSAFHPDLAIVAFGMNDRADKRRVEYKANMEKILDAIRSSSPDTEFIVVTPMLNNPLQSSGLEPVKEIRDLALSLKRPGLAFADVTSAQLAIDERKPYLDLSGNGANHPNDYLHRIYAQKVLQVLLPAQK